MTQTNNKTILKVKSTTGGLLSEGIKLMKDISKIDGPVEIVVTDAPMRALDMNDRKSNLQMNEKSI